MKITLLRYGYLPECTLGKLLLPELTLHTIERPWVPDPDGHPGGHQGQSCVPDGLYRLVPHHSAKFPFSYALVNETLGVYHDFRPVAQSWGRTAILVHSANRAGELLGCIAPGMRRGMLAGQMAVLDSVAAMDKLRAILGREEEHYVQIRPTAGTQEVP